jgi:hypothetical protein
MVTQELSSLQALELVKDHSLPPEMWRDLDYQQAEKLIQKMKADESLLNPT